MIHTNSLAEEQERREKTRANSLVLADYMSWPVTELPTQWRDLVDTCFSGGYIPLEPYYKTAIGVAQFGCILAHALPAILSYLKSEGGNYPDSKAWMDSLTRHDILDIVVQLHKGKATETPDSVGGLSFE